MVVNIIPLRFFLLIFGEDVLLHRVRITNLLVHLFQVLQYVFMLIL